MRRRFAPVFEAERTEEVYADRLHNFATKEFYLPNVTPHLKDYYPCDFAEQLNDCLYASHLPTKELP